MMALSREDEAQIGKNLIKNLGEIPGFGPIVWWHQEDEPLHGATPDWGIKVKTLPMATPHQRFVPDGGENDAAKYLGLKGILGVLTTLDYNRDRANLYLKPMPFESWQHGSGQTVQGIAPFRTDSAQRFATDVPFDNPLKDPNHPAPLLS